MKKENTNTDIYEIRTSRGYVIKKHPGEKLPYIDSNDLKYKYCDIEDCESRVFLVKPILKNKPTILSMDDLKLDYDLGYALGLSVMRIWIYNRSTGQFYVCFRANETRDRFTEILREKFKCNTAKPINRVVGISSKEPIWKKSLFICPKFLDVVDSFGLISREIFVPNIIKSLSDEFSKGMFVGLFDCMGVIIKDECKKPRRDYYRFKFLVFNKKVLYQINTILDMVAIYHSVSCTMNSYQCWIIHLDIYNIVLYPDLFFKLLTPRLINRVKEVQNTIKFPEYVPCGIKLRKKIIKIIGRHPHPERLNRCYINELLAKKFIKKLLLKGFNDKYIQKWIDMVLDKNIRFEYYKKPMLKKGS